MHCLCAIISESRQKRVYTLQAAAAAAVTTSYCGRLYTKAAVIG
jgi:NAD(P)H-hydrate repair Nnr-like enzyme with NAD(P)H-hydrate dehydratase domain